MKAAIHLPHHACIDPCICSCQKPVCRPGVRYWPNFPLLAFCVLGVYSQPWQRARNTALAKSGSSAQREYRETANTGKRSSRCTMPQKSIYRVIPRPYSYARPFPRCPAAVGQRERHLNTMFETRRERRSRWSTSTNIVCYPLNGSLVWWYRCNPFHGTITNRHRRLQDQLSGL